MSVRARVSSGDPVTSDISRSPQAPCPPTNSQVTALHHDLAAPLGTPPWHGSSRQIHVSVSVTTTRLPAGDDGFGPLLLTFKLGEHGAHVYNRRAWSSRRPRRQAHAAANAER